MKTIIFPKLFKWQKDVFDWFDFNEKIAIILSARQLGKSYLCCAELLKCAVEKPRSTSMVVEPTLSQSRKVFNDINNFVGESGIIEKANESLLHIKFINGSEILFKSGEQYQNLRGYTVDFLILDEAAYLDKEVIDILLPTTAARKASILICSTPFLMTGYFYDMFISEDTAKKKSFNWTKYDLSEVRTPEQIERYKQMFDPVRFRTEVLGEFISGNALLFQNINDCIKQPKTGQKLYIGIDLSSAVGGDYTAITVLNQDREIVDIKYDNKLEPSARIDWIADYLNSLQQVNKILVETNNMGLTVIDLLKKKIKYPITKWTTTESSKRDIIQSLQIAFENKTIGIINDQELIKELQSFGCKINPKTGKMTYEGINSKDDLVMSLAIALKGLETGNYSVKIW